MSQHRISAIVLVWLSITSCSLALFYTKSNNDNEYPRIGKRLLPDTGELRGFDTADARPDTRQLYQRLLTPREQALIETELEESVSTNTDKMIEALQELIRKAERDRMLQRKQKDILI